MLVEQANQTDDADVDAEADPAPLLSTKARRMAVECLIDVFGEAEADGFQQAEDGNAVDPECCDWVKYCPNISEADAYGFVMTIGGKRVRFRAYAEHANKANSDHGRKAKNGVPR
jgi:hypothetical protein